MSDETQLFHEYLLRAARDTPDALAVIGSHSQYTYAQLEQRATTFAEQLRRAGIRKGDFAVLDFYPCPEAVAMMLACASRGIVFVNVAADVPRERKVGIAAKVRAQVVVTRPGQGTGAPTAPVEGAITPDGALELRGRCEGPIDEPRPEIRGTDRLYIVSTSGSTGEPKGIVMSHGAVVSTLRGCTRMGVTATDRVGTVAPLPFDFAIFDLGLALGNGATLVQVPALLLHQPAGFADFVRKHRVTQMQGVPSIWNETLRTGSEGLFRDSSLHTVLYGAEAFPAPALRQLCSGLPIDRLINIFGPSESIICAFHVIEGVRGGAGVEDIEGRVSFGTAFGDVELVVVDDDGQRVTEPGASGELYFASSGLFDGYFEDPVQSAARLVADPTGQSDRVMYRTGDRVFFDEAGLYYFHSRIDNQVKILGNRVELEEIDLRLCDHPAVREAAAVVEDGDHPMIVAYVVTEPDAVVPDEAALFAEITRGCARLLPRYMLPRRYQRIDRLPRNLNGKVDRPALRRGAIQAPQEATG